MSSNFPGSADTFDNAATIHGKKQDGTADPSPPTATYHSDLLGSLGDAIEAVENSLLTGPGVLPGMKIDPDGYSNGVTFFDNDAVAWDADNTVSWLSYVFSPSTLKVTQGVGNSPFQGTQQETSLHMSLGERQAYWNVYTIDENGVVDCEIAASAITADDGTASTGYFRVTTPNSQVELEAALDEAHIRVKAATGQTLPLLDLKDEDDNPLLQYVQRIAAWAVPGIVGPAGDDSQGWIGMKAGTSAADFTVGFGSTPDAYVDMFTQAASAKLELSADNGSTTIELHASEAYNQLLIQAVADQIQPLIKLEKSNLPVFTVTTALDNVWRIDGDGAGTPIVADGGGPMQVFVRLDAVDVAFGDDQATLQAAFDAVLGSSVVVISGDWSLFTMIFAVPYSVNVVGSYELGGNPATPVLTELDPGKANAAEFVGALTVSPNQGDIGDPALNVTKYDGTPGISHLDNDGGFVFGTITGSETGSLVAKYTGVGAGDQILRASLSNDWAMFNVAAPGSGTATTITSHEATDVPLTISGWNSQTVDLLQIRDGDTDDLLFSVGATGVLNFGADVNLYRSQANVLKTDDTFFTTKDVYVQKDHTAAQVFIGEFDTDVPAIVFSTGFDTYWLRAGTNLMGTNGGIRFDEHADFSAPADAKATLYARDAGGGKTELVVRFPTGAVQVIKSEP